MLANILNAWNKTNKWHRVIGVLALTAFGVIPQSKSGFICNDSSLSHPYNGDTVSWKLLLTVAIFLPLIIIFLVESIINRPDKVSRGINKNNTLKWFAEYSYGLLLNVTIALVIKTLIGTPRPHFFDVCQPDAAVGCKESEFVASYTCTNTKYSATRIADSARSFPSGHTSIALHAGIFLAWYLHKRVLNLRKSSYYVLLTAQVILVLCAVGCALSRITDRRHHWQDVLTGAVLSVATITYSVIACKNFECVSAETGAEAIISESQRVELEKLSTDKIEQSSISSMDK